MKRRALLFGNSNGLPGVKKDLENFTKFLLSDIGGKWYKNEITILMNPAKSRLLAKIEELKNDKPDYCIVVFSGHGAYCQGNVLEINENNEYIYESQVKDISNRQLSIFDACRGVIEMPMGDIRTFSALSESIDKSVIIRQYYDQRIITTIPQQASLYSCSVGESSYDTNEGGIYSLNLLKSAIPTSLDTYKLVPTCQAEARAKTIDAVWEKHRAHQTPDHVLPKCFSSQHLILSINPRSLLMS